MSIVSQLDEGTKCWYNLEFAFGETEVRYMFDTALRKVSEVGSYTCALESMEDMRKIMQIRFHGLFVRHELLSQSEADAIFFENEEKVNMLGMKWVSSNRRMMVSYVMPMSHGVNYPERCYDVHIARVAWKADELNYWRKFWGRSDEREGVAERWRAQDREGPSGKHEVVKKNGQGEESCLCSPGDWKEARRCVCVTTTQGEEV